MNFYNIIYNGINNANNKGNLKAYFSREFKKAERDNFYNPDDFFNPLFQRLEDFKKELNKKFEDDKISYNDTIQKASRNEIEFKKKYDTHCLELQGIDYEEFKKQENKNEFTKNTKELAEFGIYKVKTTRNIPSLTFGQVELIEKGLKDAKNEIPAPHPAKNQVLELKVVRHIPNINHYGNALNNEAFKLILEPNLPNGSPRNSYYRTSIDHWVEVRKKGLAENNSFQNKVKWLSIFIDHYCSEMLTHAVVISKYANLYFYSNDPKHKGKFEGEYLKFFRFLNSFDDLIISLKLILDENVGLAFKMQGYCINRIDELMGRLDKDFHIKTRNNPIVIHFKEIKTKIENCLDFEKERFIKENQLNQATFKKQTDLKKPELSLKQIALKYCYEGLQITRQNGNQIAAQYGHTSGESLFQKFTYYSSPSNRKGKPTPCTPTKLKNKINLLNSVIELLPKAQQSRAKDEVGLLISMFENEYE